MDEPIKPSPSVPIYERLLRRLGLGAVELASFAIIWAAYALLVRRFWFITEDAFISFRYARYWGHGQGLRYNLGDAPPVEGYTNFLWVAVCAIVEWLGGAAPDWAPRLSFAIASGLLFWVLRSLRVTVGLGTVASIAGTAWLALFPGYFVWSTSGLEGAAYMAAVFVAFERMALRPGAPALVAGAIAGVALTLIRAEGIAWAVTIALASAVVRRARDEPWVRPILQYLGCVLGTFVLAMFFRWANFGSLVPNTAYAKVGVGPATLVRGLQYVTVYFMTFPALLVTMAGAPLYLRLAPRAVGASVLMIALAFYGYAVLIGGDFMTMGRVVLPTLPIHAMWVGIAFDRLYSMPRTKWVAIAGAVALIAVSLLPAWDRHVVPNSIRARFHFRHNRDVYHSEFWVWRLQRDNHYALRGLGKALARYAKPGDSFITGVIGNIGYYSDLVIYDQHGLVTPEVARLPLKQERLRSPGHDKLVPKTFFLNRRPTYWDAALFDATGAQKRLLEWTAPYEAFGLKHNYVPDFVILADGPWYSAPKVLCVIRAGDDRPAAQAWRQFRGRARRM